MNTYIWCMYRDNKELILSKEALVAIELVSFIQMRFLNCNKYWRKFFPLIMNKPMRSQENYFTKLRLGANAKEK